MSPAHSKPAIRPSNRLGLDYETEARRMPAPPVGLVDVHTHLNGPASAAIFARACDLYGVRRVYSMTQLEQVEAVQSVLGDRVRFIAVPNYMGEDRRHHHGPGFVERIRRFHESGARVVKFWAAPRGLDYGRESGDPDLLRLDAPWRVKAMELAAELGMIFMVHVADPDTWFATKYRDASVYGTKLQQYEPFERLLDRFDGPWIAAHLGGWPEDLGFLSGLLERHDNLHLDTSATKWMVRELGRHDPAEVRGFLDRFQGRVLFGSDIVAADEHLAPGGEGRHESLAKASSADEAFDLYASRYWALRTMFESTHDGPSPIADPDLAMVDPEQHGEMDAPPLVGMRVGRETLEWVYARAAERLLGT